MFMTKTIKTSDNANIFYPSPSHMLNMGKMTNVSFSKGHPIYFHVCKGKYQDILVIEEVLRFVPIAHVFNRLHEVMEFSFGPK